MIMVNYHDIIMIIACYYISLFPAVAEKVNQTGLSANINP